MATPRWIAEYPSVIARASQEGWLAPLAESNATACTTAQATRILQGIDALPLGQLRLHWHRGAFRGWTGFRRRNDRWIGGRISLPMIPGTRSGYLRVGLVLHEAAHVLHHRKGGRGHGQEFCNELRQLITRWTPMSVSSFREIYDRHRGPYALDFILEMDQKGRTVQGSDHLEGTYSAEDAHEEARILLKQRPEIVEIFVRSISENQYIGAFYRRGEDHRPWHEEEEHGRVELPDHEDRRSGWPPPASARPAPALVPEREEPLPAVDAPIDERLPAETLPTHRPVRDVPPEAPPRKRREPTKLPGDRFPAVRGRALGFVAERAEEWPSSAGPQALLTLIRRSPGPFRMTTAEIVQAMGSQLRELGVEHPASMVSRLKQAGLLHDVPSCV